MTVGTIAHDRAVAILARGLVDAGSAVAHLVRGDDPSTAVAAEADAGTVVGLSVRGCDGVAALPAVLAIAPGGGPAARSMFVGGDVSSDQAAVIEARHRVRVFSRDCKTRDIVDWLHGAPPA